MLKSLSYIHWDPIWAAICVLAVLLPFSCLLMVWVSSRGWHKTLGPCTQMAGREEAPGPCLRICSGPAKQSLEKLNQQMEGFSLGISFSLQIRLLPESVRSLFFSVFHRYSKEPYLFLWKSSYQ